MHTPAFCLLAARALLVRSLVHSHSIDCAGSALGIVFHANLYLAVNEVILTSVHHEITLGVRSRIVVRKIAPRFPCCAYPCFDLDPVVDALARLRRSAAVAAERDGG